MRRTFTLVVLLSLALVIASSAVATPGNGRNTVYIFNDCDSGVGKVTLVGQASDRGLFATAHLLASNRPAPLISLAYKVVLDDIGVVDSGSYSHSHPQQGQLIVNCTGYFDIPDGRIEIEVSGFFPAGL
jgi:hypothetical protein